MYESFFPLNFAVDEGKVSKFYFLFVVCRVCPLLSFAVLASCHLLSQRALLTVNGVVTRWGDSVHRVFKLSFV